MANVQSFRMCLHMGWKCHHFENGGQISHLIYHQQLAMLKINFFLGISGTSNLKTLGAPIKYLGAPQQIFGGVRDIFCALVNSPSFDNGRQ